MRIDEQTAIAVPRRAHRIPESAPKLPPRSLDIEVLKRFPIRDQDNPQWIDPRFALRKEDGSLDQTRCDPRCQYVGVEFDEEFKGMTKALCGGDHEQVFLGLYRTTKREFVEMINNRVPPSLQQYLATPLERQHCQSERQWTNLNKGLAEGQSPHGVTLRDYSAQAPWEAVIPCAHIPVPSEQGQQAYARKFGDTAFDDYAIETRVSVAGDPERDPSADQTCHAALYGCGIAQLFNGAEPGEQFHIVFANARLKMRDPDGRVHEMPLPIGVPVNQVPESKQPLAWYGDGWFETRGEQFDLAEEAEPHPDALPAHGEAPMLDPDVSSPDAGPSAGARQKTWKDLRDALEHAEDRSAITQLRDALFQSSQGPASKRNTRKGPTAPWSAYHHVRRALDFTGRIGMPLADWVREHDAAVGTPEERVQALLSHAAKVGLPYSSVARSGGDIWRLKPLMQQLLGLTPRVDPPRVEVPRLRLALDAIEHGGNRLELIQLKAAVEDKLPRTGAPHTKRYREIVTKLQKEIINPAAQFLKWLGPRSASDWVTQNLPASRALATEEDVQRLSNQLRAEGGGVYNRAYYRPILRQVLGLPSQHATSILPASPFADQLEQLHRPDFDMQAWEKKIPGFTQLPDDEARASLMKLWEGLVPTELQAYKMSKQAKQRKMGLARRCIQSGLYIYQQWPAPGALRQWVADRQAGMRADASPEQRWSVLLGGLKQALPSANVSRLSDGKRLIMSLLQQPDPAAAGSANDAANEDDLMDAR